MELRHPEKESSLVVGWELCRPEGEVELVEEKMEVEAGD